MSTVYRRTQCQHCKRFRIVYARDLCKTCYTQNAIRCLYPPVEKPGRAAFAAAGLPLPTKMPSPTRARPGTEEKVQELERRAAAGEYLWHPQDARGE